MVATTETEHRVLDHGFIRLDDCMADDLSVVNSARVSFHVRHDALDDSDEKLIGFLMRNRHGTPFEHNSFRFHVKAPLVIFREWQRHRIGSFNEWSARYSELEGEFYLPDTDNVRTQVGKPGAYHYEYAGDDEAQEFVHKLVDSQMESYQLYQDAIAYGVAKEQARLFLPISIYSEMYWTVNARSLMNFLSLRNSPQAMWEIRQYAAVLEGIFGKQMPLTYEAFIANDRVAP